MGKGPMPDVVKERRGKRIARAVARHLMPKRQLSMNRTKSREKKLHHERRAERMREPRVLGPWKCERRHPELPNTAKALHFGRVDERLDDALFVGLECHEPMNRIPQNHVECSPRGTMRVPMLPSS